MTLPAHLYRDPADVIEQQELRELGCRACAFHAVYLNRVVCTNPKVLNHKKVPYIGSKCKQFKLKG